MEGAAGAILASRDPRASAAFGELVGSWVDGANTTEAHRALSARLQGALVVAAPLFEADPSFCTSLMARVEALDEPAFLQRLPAFRDGFLMLSPAARRRLLAALEERLGLDERDLELNAHPDALARQAHADGFARAWLKTHLDGAIREGAS
jgi:hypothetical protein